MDDDEGPGVPKWVVTYGDMMSLLLTFFIMLVSLSEVIEEHKYRAILDAIQKYTGYQTGPLAPPGKHFPLDSLIQRLNTLGSFINKERGFRGVRIKAPEGTNVRVLRTREGTAIQVGKSLAFQPGSDSLSDDVKQQLVDIAKDLAGKPNKIELRGHASPDLFSEDSLKTHKMILSYKRAYHVLQFLVENGIEKNRMRISAYSDLQPAHLTGDKKEVKHDRVEIYTIDAFAAEFVGPPKTPD